MAPQPISVTRDGEVLTLTPSPINLSTGDSVEWTFPELDSNELAVIRFHSPENAPSGPFEFLEIVRSKVVGSGNSGIHTVYRYTALILNNDRAVATSDGQAVIHNLATETEVDTSPVATVSYNGKLDVQPPVLKLKIGRSALWRIEPLPEGNFVTFDFDDCADLMVGPFLFIGESPGFGGSRFLIGSHFTGPLDRNQISVHYHVKLRNAEGTVIDKKDPIIDRLGGPPDPA